MNVLIVNGSGSIGSALVSELSSESVNVVYTSSNNSESYDEESIHWKYSGEVSVKELFEDLKSNCFLGSQSLRSSPNGLSSTPS